MWNLWRPVGPEVVGRSPMPFDIAVSVNNQHEVGEVFLLGITVCVGRTGMRKATNRTTWTDVREALDRVSLQDHVAVCRPQGVMVKANHLCSVRNWERVGAYRKASVDCGTTRFPQRVSRDVHLSEDIRREELGIAQTPLVIPCTMEKTRCEGVDLLARTVAVGQHAHAVICLEGPRRVWVLWVQRTQRGRRPIPQGLLVCDVNGKRRGPTVRSLLRVGLPAGALARVAAAGGPDAGGGRITARTARRGVRNVE